MPFNSLIHTCPTHGFIEQKDLREWYSVSVCREERIGVGIKILPYIRSTCSAPNSASDLGKSLVSLSFSASWELSSCMLVCEKKSWYCSLARNHEDKLKSSHSMDNRWGYWLYLGTLVSCLSYLLDTALRKKVRKEICSSRLSFCLSVSNSPRFLLMSIFPVTVS